MKSEFFFDIFLKKTEISNLMKIHPVGAELLHADGQTDRTNLIAAFCNSANVPKSECIKGSCVYLFYL
jgi:hypothetical protein